jgi:ankyrin repeat protein
MKKMMYVSVACGFLLFTKMSFAAQIVDVSRDLLSAAHQGDIQAAQNALNAGANVDTRSHNDSTPLILAPLNGTVDLVLLLLDRGADINAQAKDGRTALMIAAANGNIEVVSLLLEKGANVFARDNANKTALDLAENEQVKKMLRDFIDKLNSQEAKERPTQKTLKS